MFEQRIRLAAVSFMQLPQAVGLSIGVVRNGETVCYHYGEVERGTQRQPTDTTLYEIGSITKTFTGLLLAYAVEENKLRLDDDIRLYLDGDYPNLAYHGQPIRLWHLSSHLSGLPLILPNRSDLFETPDPKQLPYLLHDFYANGSLPAFYAALRTVTLQTEPGSTLQYSNAAVQLLGYILERVYAQPYEQLIQRFIAVPLAMPRTRITYTADERALFASGYDDEGQIMPALPPQAQAAGAISSCLADMVNYVAFQLAENNEAVRTSHRVFWGDSNEFAMGLNWHLNRTPAGHRCIYHSGGSFGFASYCAIYPALHTGIILLANESDMHTQARLEQIALAAVAESREDTGDR